MTTINGVTFNMQTLEIISEHRNIPTDEPGYDADFVTSIGRKGLVLRLDGFEESLTVYDNVIKEFMKTGEQTLVHRTGWQFKVYSTQLIPVFVEGNTDNYFPYELILLTSTPYRESISETSRSKSVTTNNQEWTQDDSTNDIDTDGSVDAVPDIKVTGGVDSVYTVLDPNPISEPGFETINDWAYSELDTGNHLSGGQDSIKEYEGTYCYKLEISGGYVSNNYAKITQTIDLANIKKIIFRYRQINDGWFNPNVYFQVLAGNSIIASYSMGGGGDTGWMEKTVEINSSEQSLSFRTFSVYNITDPLGMISYIDAIVAYGKSPTKDPEIYNTADTTVKCAVGNVILDGAIHRINVDGTGTIDFDDDFSTEKYGWTRHDSLNVTHDATDDELDIADDGYIYWKCDAKYPINGIPTLKSRINITAGTPTIQISSDGSTWYDITTAIIDDVETTYDLDSSSLHLKGKTLFYWRVDCVKAAAATCSIKNFELDVNMFTIYAEHPKIPANGVSTVRCDQDDDSSMICTVVLYYRDRSWSI